MDNNSKELLAKLNKIFESDECVVCTDGKKDERNLDTIFYQCGHQCCHYECGKKLSPQKCPLCREYISAFIKV